MPETTSKQTSKQPQSTLSAHNLKKRYKARTVVHDVSFEVKSGEVVGLLGPNGAGKTTCFYMVVGLVACDGGDVHLDDAKLTHQPIHKRAQLGVSYLPQEASVFRKLTVSENIKAVLELRKLPADEIEHRLESLLEELHIGHIRNNQAAALSGGERRRVEIARALAALRPARRTLRRRRSDRRPRNPEDHPLPQGTADRRAHHRPQRARNAGHLRPRLHHQRGAGAGLWPPGRNHL